MDVLKELNEVSAYIENHITENIEKTKLIIRNATVQDADGICKICCDDLGYNCTVDLVKKDCRSLI